MYVPRGSFSWECLIISFLCSRGVEHDAQDITFAINRYWNRVDINRIPEQEMKEFVRQHKAAAPGWSELRRKYGL